MKSSRTTLLGLAALASIGDFFGGTSFFANEGGYSGSRRTSTSTSTRPTGPGWSNAHAKRVAHKACNVKRHRAASRGKA